MLLHHERQGYVYTHAYIHLRTINNVDFCKYIKTLVIRKNQHIITKKSLKIRSATIVTYRVP